MSKQLIAFNYSLVYHKFKFFIFTVLKCLRFSAAYFYFVF